MPAPKKAVPYKTSKITSNRKAKKKGSWLGSFFGRRYMKPATVVVAFMIVGAATLLWAMAATTTTSLWSTNTVPATLSSSDASNIELGLRFKADVAGYVTGVKFYKSAQNTGTHTGNLWDGHGNLLSSVTFSGETASGWQTANFAQPVSIAANTVYTISYHAPSGHYSYNNKYFSRSAFTNGHLTAVKNTSTRANGVYVRSTSQYAFPTASGNGTNYWVDVLFTTSLLNPNPAPAAPTGVTAVAPSSSSVQVTWQASVSANPITNYAVYRNGSKVADAGTALSYTDTTVAASTTYTYQVQAVDSTSTASAMSSTATVTTPASGGTTGSTTCPLPAYPTPSCTGVPKGTTVANTVSGDYTATTAGQVIDSWHITGDLVIQAANVVIKNTQVDGTITNDGIANTSYNVSDSTVGTATCALGGQPSLNGHDITAIRVLLQGHADGIDMGGDNVTISDSYVKPCFLPGSIVGSDGYHTDGVQDQCSATCSNIALTHDTFDARAYYGGQSMGNSALNLGSSADGLHIRNVTLANNLFMGGGYTTDLRWDAGNYWTVTNNAWVSGAYAYAPISTEGTCAQQNWSGNTLVAIDSAYNVTGTIAPQPCVD